MTLHRLLPLISLILNLCLVAISLLRNPASRLNRIFAYFVSALALWNLGVLMLRLAPHPTSADRWAVSIQVGVLTLAGLCDQCVAARVTGTLRRPQLVVR